MKLLIDIPEDDYKFIKDMQVLMVTRGNCKTIQYNVINAIKNGVPCKEVKGGEVWYGATLDSGGWD